MIRRSTQPKCKTRKSFVRRGLIFIVLIFSFVTLSGIAIADPGSTLKTDSVRAEPYPDAKILFSIAKGEQIDILARNGGWLRIKHTRGSGWIRMLSVKRGQPPKTNSAAQASGVLKLASGRAGTGQVVSTTGIRGLSEEELKSAKYNAEELKKAQSYAVSAADAQLFASKGKLVARRVAYLPNPGN